MILRRLTANLRRQDWTAVAIELVIVVLGVFIGMQVSNWNAARVARAQESTQLAQLRGEILANQKTLDYQEAYTREVVASGRRALAWLESGDPSATRCAELLIDFFHASEVWGTPLQTTKFDENQRLGFPSNPATRTAVQEYYLTISGWTLITLTPPPYRERVRGHISPDAATVLWTGCFHQVEGLYEVLGRDCAPKLANIDLAALLQAIRGDRQIADELRFWLGQNIFALSQFRISREYADKAIAAINQDLGETP